DVRISGRSNGDCRTREEDPRPRARNFPSVVAVPCPKKCSEALAYCVAGAVSRILRADREGNHMHMSRRSVVVAGLVGGIVALNSHAADEYARFESLDKRFDELIAPGTAVEKIA